MYVLNDLFLWGIYVKYIYVKYKQDASHSTLRLKKRPVSPDHAVTRACPIQPGSVTVCKAVRTSAIQLQYNCNTRIFLVLQLYCTFADR